MEEREREGKQRKVERDKNRQEESRTVGKKSKKNAKEEE